MIKSILTLTFAVFSLMALAQDLHYSFDKGCDCYGYVDGKGNLVIPYRYSSASKFSEGMAAVWLNRKWGYIDEKGNLVIPYSYEYAKEFRGGLAAVIPDGKTEYGYIDKKGKMVIAARFKSAFSFNENGTAMVSSSTKSNYYIDKTGKEINGNGKETVTATASSPPALSQKISGPGNILYTEEEITNLKIAKAAGNLEYMGFMYIDHGALEEGTALVKQAIAKGNCENCAYTLAYKTYMSRISKTALQSCNSAAARLQNANSVNEAVETLKKMDAKGDMPLAAYYLAGGFSKGQIHSPKKEIDSAMYYYEKAAKQGFPPAKYALGLLYEYGTGNTYPIPRDRNPNAYLIDAKKARYWYNESAKMGLQSALIKVASLDQATSKMEVADAYNKGYAAFEAKNFEEAYRWWTVSALEGKDAAAYYGLAALHHMGKAPESNYNKAIEYYQKAADLGMKEALTEKQKVLDYFAALNEARQKSTTTTSTTSSKGESYEAWWQKTYGKGGTQNRTPMPNNNIPQATYRTGSKSESDRHQSAMDQIYRDTQRQMERSFKKN